MTWVKDGVLDCEELWALLAVAGYEEEEGLPRRAWPTCPVVSGSEKPGVVCFVMAEDRRTWMARRMGRRRHGRSRST